MKGQVENENNFQLDLGGWFCTTEYPNYV